MTSVSGTTHFSKGSHQPEKIEGNLRLYSMKYCPYAHRTRLVLLAKNIPHDIVNVNLINKPEWLFNVHPDGIVPVLDVGSKTVTESLQIADFLDREYPDPPLYPEEAEAREADKALIDKIGPLTKVFFKIIFQQETKTSEEWLKEFEPHLNEFEDELKKRGTKFFGGDRPGMVDYMLWPWGERAGAVTIALGERLPVAADRFPLLRNWRKEMRAHPVVDIIYNGPEKFYKTVLFKTAGLEPDYDSI